MEKRMKETCGWNNTSQHKEGRGREREASGVWGCSSGDTQSTQIKRRGTSDIKNRWMHRGQTTHTQHKNKDRKSAAAVFQLQFLFQPQWRRRTKCASQLFAFPPLFPDAISCAKPSNHHRSKLLLNNWSQRITFVSYAYHLSRPLPEYLLALNLTLFTCTKHGSHQTSGQKLIKTRSFLPNEKARTNKIARKRSFRKSVSLIHFVIQN